MKETKQFVMLKRQDEAKKAKCRRVTSGVKVQSGVRAGRYDPYFADAWNR